LNQLTKDKNNNLTKNCYRVLRNMGSRTVTYPGSEIPEPAKLIPDPDILYSGTLSSSLKTWTVSVLDEQARKPPHGEKDRL